MTSRDCGYFELENHTHQGEPLNIVKFYVSANKNGFPTDSFGTFFDESFSYVVFIKV